MDPSHAASSPQDEFIDERPPPPSYMEVLSSMAEKSSEVQGLTDPSLTYMDFLPRHIQQTYQDLVDDANKWLASNRQFKLQSCETLTIQLNKVGSPEIQSSFLHVPSCGVKQFVRALRLWLVRRADQSEHSEILRTMAKVPDRDLFAEEFAQFNIAHSVSIVLCKAETFGRFSKCLEALNAQLRDSPLPGRVLKIETVQMKVTELFEPVDLDPERVYWTEGENCKIFANTLRLFYIEGPPAEEELGWKDFTPAFINGSLPDSPRFEPFTEILFKAGHWAYTQKDIKITNIQTLDTRIVPDFFKAAQMSLPNLDTDRVEVYERNCGVVQFVRFLRIYFVKPKVFTSRVPYCLTQRPFLPSQTAPRSYESPAQNIRRLVKWIDFNSQIFSHSGIGFEQYLLCPETVRYEVHPGLATEVDHEQTTYKYRHGFGHYYVHGVRLYLNGMFYEPPAGYLGIPSIKPATESECCRIV